MHEETIEQELLKMAEAFEDSIMNLDKHDRDRYFRLKAKIRSGDYTWQDKYEVIHYENTGSFNGVRPWNDGTLR